MSKPKMVLSIMTCLFALLLSGQIWANNQFNVSFSPDGGMFLAKNSDQITLWETKAGKLLKTFGSPKEDIYFDFAVFSANGKEVLLRNIQGELVWWNIASGKSHSVKMMKWLFVSSISRDRKTIATFGSSISKSSAFHGDMKFIHLYDTKTGKLTRKISIPDDDNKCLTFFPDDKLIAVTGINIKIISIKTGRVIKTIPKSLINFSCAVSPDKKSMLFNNSFEKAENGIWLEGLDGTKPKYPEKSSMDLFASTWSIGYSPNDPNIAFAAGLAAGKSGIMIIWDLRTGKVLQKFAHPFWLTNAAISPDGKTMLVQDATDTQVSIDIETGTVIRKYSTNSLKEKDSETAHYSPSVYNMHVLAR